MPMPMPMLSDQEWAYLAGLIDGEGAVNIDRTVKQQGRYTVYRPSLSISSTTPVLIDWCYERLPIGSRYVAQRNRPGWAPSHRILWVYKAALHILQGARPWLVLKGDQADVVLGMPLSSNGRWGFTEEIRVGQLEAWERIREIRRSKGPAPREVPA